MKEINENKKIEAELKKGEYFTYGEHYYITFKYYNDEQRKRIYDAFENELLPSCGSKSYRGRQGKDFIMPYLIDANGQFTITNSSTIGGTSIPEDLLSEFIRRLVELDGVSVKVGDEVISDKFSYEKFDQLLENFNNKHKKAEAELQKGEYFTYGEHYYITFKYYNDEQRKRIYDAFENELLPSCGSKSYRGLHGEEYIMPYLVDANGHFTINSKTIGGTSIPEDLLSEFIRRLVELDGVSVKVGDEVISDKFSYESFNQLLESLNNEKMK